jgi:bacillithiol biosynthesis cysteine-adding enzyme BshC
MKHFSIPFHQGMRFSALDCDYASDPIRFSHLTRFSPDESGIIAAAEKRKNNQNTDRALLVRGLLAQYDKYKDTQPVLQNIQAFARPNTFAIITAHQPVLMGGPLYIVYKILSAIKLAKQLNKVDKDNTYIPVFVIGSEDHDLEEINHFHIYNKKITWETTQEGPAGRFNTEGLLPLLTWLEDEHKGNEHASALLLKLNHALKNSPDYGSWYHFFLHTLFGQYGLVVANMDRTDFKYAFKEVMERELNDSFSLEPIMEAQRVKQLMGYREATFLRPINLFYFHENKRLRLETVEGSDKIALQDTNIIKTKKEWSAELEKFPERFSPNVNLRPLYQESIFPGVAYVGGGGELAYWLERKEQFALSDIPFPALIRRDSVLWLDTLTIKKLEKTSLKVTDFFQPTDQLIKNFLHQHSTVSLELTVEKQLIEDLFEAILIKSLQIDQTLRGPVEGEKIKILKSIEHLEQRLLRAEKNQQDTAVRQVQYIVDKIFPNNHPQERYDNFLPYYFKLGNTYFDILLESLEPLRRELKVILEDGTF